MGTDTVDRTGDIEAGADREFQRAWWRVQWVSWVVLSLLVLAGLAGLFGRGPLATTTATSPDGRVEVKYDRFARRGYASAIEVRVDPSAVRDRKIQLGLSPEAVETLQPEKTDPPPVRAEAGSDGTRFTFAADPDGGPVTIRFSQQPKSPGRVGGQVAVAGAGSVAFPQFVYP